MKKVLRKIFSPILAYFESGEDEYSYKESHRKILIFVGVLFIFLSSVLIYKVANSSNFGGLLPIVVFLSVGVVCEVVGLLGNDRAVAKIWKSK